eukprot:TRINITY_DN6583_c0_g2_i1.p1 TRINITY_DN6583_c0_g2~~TRINITY_DN6583_c0_g2_i1.p1  ORF type:complete len:461 (-),score=133.15 TRINITY_DN6583_c0_g2_i1:289-1671(-)
MKLAVVTVLLFSACVASVSAGVYDDVLPMGKTDKNQADPNSAVKRPQSNSNPVPEAKGPMPVSNPPGATAETAAPAYQPVLNFKDQVDSVPQTTGGPNIDVYQPAQNFADKHPLDGDLAPFFRYWNPKIRNHFYTVDFGIFGSGKEGWIYQGIQCYVHRQNKNGTVPLYRYWNTRILDDYFTVQNDVPASTGYLLKGIAAYVSVKQQVGQIPLYRYYNKEIADHYYTTNANVLGTGRDGWVLQGVASYVWPHPTEATKPQPVQPGSVQDAITKGPIAPTHYVAPAPMTSGSTPPGFNASTGGAVHIPLPAEASSEVPLIVPLYRYWNSVYRDHFYTTNWAEVGAGGHEGWEYQGVQALIFSNPQPNTKPLHRYWNIRTLDHFYTTNFDALGHAGNDGWKYEGIQGYIFNGPQDGAIPLFRYFSSNFNDHFYTTKDLGNSTQSWVREGVQGYVLQSFFTDC